MEPHKESFLRNEFLTMSVLGALERSNTYSKSTLESAKISFRNALRKTLDEISLGYGATVEEQEHLLKIQALSDDLSAKFSHCLKGGRFRIGVAQKALNLYLKYLWCVGFIPLPPHCPFDSVIIGHLPSCRGMKWTEIDAIEDYERLVESAREKADGVPLPEWELITYTASRLSGEDGTKHDRPISLC